jgi:hypothetical protein
MASAVSEFLEHVEEVRERLVTTALTVVLHELSRQKREASERVASEGQPRVKALLARKQLLTLWDAEHLVPRWHADRLRRAFHNVYARALAETYDASTQGFGLRGRLTAEDTRRFVAEAGERLVGVTETTRNAVREALRDGLLARDEPYQLAKRLRSLPEFTEVRARTVAETEVAHATNAAAMLAYGKDSRVVGVRLHDRERCAPTGGPCAGMNGRVLTMQEAAATPLLFHPNCSAMRSPIMPGRGE